MSKAGEVKKTNTYHIWEMKMWSFRRNKPKKAQISKMNNNSKINKIKEFVSGSSLDAYCMLVKTLQAFSKFLFMYGSEDGKYFIYLACI